MDPLNKKPVNRKSSLFSQAVNLNPSLQKVDTGSDEDKWLFDLAIKKAADCPHEIFTLSFSHEELFTVYGHAKDYLSKTSAMVKRIRNTGVNIQDENGDYHLKPMVDKVFTDKSGGTLTFMFHTATVKNMATSSVVRLKVTPTIDFEMTKRLRGRG